MAAHYNSRTGIWPYSSVDVTPQETWHNGPVVYALLKMNHDVGQAGLVGQFKRWPVDGGNILQLPLDCARRDSQYNAVRASATKSYSSNADILTSRTAYVYTALEVQEICGD